MGSAAYPAFPVGHLGFRATSEQKDNAKCAKKAVWDYINRLRIDEGYERREQHDASFLATAENVINAFAGYGDDDSSFGSILLLGFLQKSQQCSILETQISSSFVFISRIEGGRVCTQKPCRSRPTRRKSPDPCLTPSRTGFPRRFCLTQSTQNRRKIFHRFCVGFAL